MQFSKDSASSANIEDFIIKHTHFDWKLDFDHQRIHGSVTHSVIRRFATSDYMILDAINLDIRQVFINKEQCEFQYLESYMGNKLKISIHDKRTEFNVKILYSTQRSSRALQWMTPEMTYSGKFPYVYSQGSTIHARSLYPCQDSPSVKATYTAAVEAPSYLEVLMSAIKTSSTVVDDRKHHKFTQKIPIPSYLVALACGNIVGCKIGLRSSLWSEPEILEKAKWEFEEIDNILSCAEEFTGDYEWEICDLLILPPSFPYGGMENPCLIFLTPCLLTGDRSQICYVVHEITHAWTGNLVTNSNWEHFWLNEGHANYLERLILEKLHDSSEFRHFQILLGLAHFEESLNILNKIHGSNHELTKLVPQLSGIHPDNYITSVPYEKGSFLLFYLEKTFGKDRMLRWLKSYIKTFRLKSVSTNEWKLYFIEYMTTVEEIELDELNSFDWDSWFYGTGNMPLNPRSLLNHSLTIPCYELVQMWQMFCISSHDQKDLLHRFEVLKPDQKYYFFNLFNDIEDIKLPVSTLQVMKTLYDLTKTTNPQILYGWSMLCLRSHFEPAIDQIFEFLNSQGRLIYHKPLYKFLSDWSVTNMRTKQNFEEQKNRMHPVTKEEVRKILYPTQLNEN